jgi:hypothetical protein
MSDDAPFLTCELGGTVPSNACIEYPPPRQVEIPVLVRDRPLDILDPDPRIAGHIEWRIFVPEWWRDRQGKELYVWRRVE